MRLLFTIFFFLCLLNNAATQQRGKRYTFMHFTTANGLPSNLISSIVQDEEGYMWFATVTGISRYDGYRFLNFAAARNDPSFVFGNVVLLYYDKNHDIWFVTADYKVGILNARNFSVKEVDGRVLRKMLYQGLQFFETQDGTVMIQEFLGATYRYDGLRNRFVKDSTTIPFPPGWHGSQIVWDSSIHKYWLPCDMGLALYNPGTKALSYPGHNLENEILVEKYKSERNILALKIDKEKNINFYAWPPNSGNPYVHHYNRQRGEGFIINLSDKAGISYHEIVGFLEQRNGRMWIFGRPVFGQWLPNQKDFIPVANEYRNEQSMKYDAISTAFEDGELNIWAGTDNGLFMFNPDAQLFENHTYPKPKGEEGTRELSANTLLQLPDSTILVGCWGPGLFKFDKAFHPLPLSKNLQALLKVDPSIWDMHQHSKTGDIWIVLQGGDIIVYSPKTDRGSRFNLDIFDHRTIRQVTEDSSGNLWFGTQHGVVIKWDFTKASGNPRTSYTRVLTGGNRILKLLKDTEGAIWVATLGFGVYKIDAQRETVVMHLVKSGPPGRRLSDDVVTDLLQYDSSTMIAVSQNLNLITIKTGQVRYFTTADGLPSNTGVCIEKDRYGVLWLGLSNGLCRLNIKEGLFTLYGRNNGIDYDNFNPAGASRLLDGRIVFTTDHNLLELEPQKFLTGAGIPPDPEFCAIRLSGKFLSVDSLLNLGKVELNYDNSSIAIQFSILSFLSQKQPDYSYLLEGFDKTWTTTNGTNEAAYSYLPPGEYVFKVKAVNQDGLHNGKPTELVIVVHPPFWRTLWFYGLMTLLGIGILYLVDKERQKRQQALQAVRTQIAGDLHEEINVTLNDINLLSEIAKLKADRDIERSKDYIDQISTKSRTMIESMDDILWSIDPENDSMERMLLRIYEFTDGIKKTNGLDTELTVDKEVEQLTLDMKTRHEFLLFYKDALLYVIEHSVCATIYISVEYIKGKLALKLLAQCNQLDEPAVLTPKLEYGMQRRADALKGMLDIMSDRKSISIILLMPV